MAGRIPHATRIAFVAAVVTATLCKSCPPGKFAVEEDGCRPCAPGRFQEDEDQLSCNFCEPGRSAGAGEAVCQICEAGRYSNANETSCLKCPVGRAQPESQQIACAVCARTASLSPAPPPDPRPVCSTPGAHLRARLAT